MAASERETKELMAGQLAVWYAQQLAPENPVYHIAEYVELRGNLDTELFLQALRATMVEAEAVRLRIRLVDNEPRQYLGAVDDHSVQILDVTAEPDPHTAAETWMTRRLRKPMRLLGEPLTGHALIKVGQDRHYWLHYGHHLIMDGYSGQLFANRLAQRYTALSEGREAGPDGGLEPISVLLDEDRTYRASPAHAEDRQFWTDALSDTARAARAARSDGYRPRRLPQVPVRRRDEITPGETDDLKRNARRLGTSLAGLSIAAAAVQHHRTTGARDVVIGIPVLGRAGRLTRDIPGMTSNILPIRVSIGRATTTTDLLRQIAAEMRAALRHQRYRYEDMLRDLKLLGGDPLCDLIVNVMSFDYRLDFGPCTGTAHNLANGPIDTLSIDVYDRRDGTGLQVDADIHRGAREREPEEAVCPRFVRTLRQLAHTEPADLLSRIDILSAEERSLLLGEWKDTAVETLTEPSVRALLDTQAATSRVYVLDAELRPVPPGVIGELYVAGAVDRARLTPERLVADPFEADGSRMYRAEVRARWSGNGELEFPGAAGGAEPDRRTQDRTTERIADAEAGAGPDAGPGPVDTRADVLRALFAEILDLESVEVDDDFFDLGGHSLLATQLVSRIRSTLNVELPMRAVFEEPTVAGLLGRLADADTAHVVLAGRGRPERVPLSYAQRRLWFLGRLEGPSATYNTPVVLKLTGQLDSAALKTAMRDVLDRHEALRTVLPTQDGEPYQSVIRMEELDWEIEEITVRDSGGAYERLSAMTDLPEAAASPAATASELAEAVVSASAHVFDLSAQVPVKVWLFRTERLDEHVLVVLVHHIAGDGWSMGPLARDISTAYAARCADTAPAWDPLPVQYVDYTLWQRELLGSDDDPGSVLSRQVAYWREALAGAPEELALPLDRPRPAVPSHRGRTAVFGVPGEVHARLLDLARAEGVTPFMVLHGALAVLLSRLGAGADIPIGSAVAGRTDEALDDLVGCFVNTLVMRTDLSGDPTFTEVVSRVREAGIGAFEHQDVPFERLVEELAPQRSLARHPLFQVVLTMNDVPDELMKLPGLRAELISTARPAVKFDLDVMVGEVFDADGAPAGVRGSLTAAADLFDEGAAERIAGWLVRVLEELVSAPATRVSQVEVLSAAERQRVLVDWNDTSVALGGVSVLGLFGAWVVGAPGAVAVVQGGVELTYAALDARANRLARFLRVQGVGAESVVGLCLPRGVEMLVGMLAVWKAGAGYLPVDVGQPAERVAFMLGDSRAVLTLTT
ncbi:condensation domain-containing protein, partial [Streptomyces prunicolor]